MTHQPYLKTGFRIALLFMLYFSPVHAQTVSGTIRDAASGDAIPFVAVEYGPGQGVISNDEGFFELPISPETNQILNFSCLGFKNSIIPISDLKPQGNVITMEESVVVLEGVMLSNREPNAERIITEARSRLINNHSLSYRSFRIFSRESEYMDFDELQFQMQKATEVPKVQLRHTNSELDSLAQEVMTNRAVHFKDYLGTLYIADAGQSKLKVDKATSMIDARKDFSMEGLEIKAREITEQYLDPEKSYRLKTGWFKIEDSLDIGKDDEKSKDYTYSVKGLKHTAMELMVSASTGGESGLGSLLDNRLYAYTLQKTTFYKDEIVYIISFAPRKSKASFGGTLFINGNDYGIVKVDYGYAEGKRGKKVNLKLLFGIKYHENILKGTLLFERSSDGNYLPVYIQRTSGRYFYVDRPLKFIENGSGKTKVKLDFTVAGNSLERTELLISSSAALEGPTYEAIASPEKVSYIPLSKYDESLWKGEQVLIPLEEMREFRALE